MPDLKKSPLTVESKFFTIAGCYKKTGGNMQSGKFLNASRMGKFIIFEGPQTKL